MKRQAIGVLPWALGAMLFGYCSQAFAQGFTAGSLNGTYYIPCACEGEAHNGKAIYTGGTGEVTFNSGDKTVTLTQHDVYTEQKGKFTRLVADTIILGTNQMAERKGTYTVDTDGHGYGHIVWYPDYGGCDPVDDCPSFLITAADQTTSPPSATAVYMIIPNGVPGVLIHVTATKR